MMQRCVASRRRDVRARPERGSALPFVLAAFGVLVVVGASLGVVGAVVVDHRRAQSAADLAALAGAIALGQGGDGCATAERIASSNGARIASCAAADRGVTLTAVVGGHEILGRAVDLSAEARAGPG